MIADAAGDNTVRIDYRTVAAEATRALYDASGAIRTSSLDPRVRELVAVLVSRRNGCAHCIRVHTRKALAAGVSEKQLGRLKDRNAPWNTVPGARFDEADDTANSFSKPEIVALALADQLTLRPREGVGEKLWTAAVAEYREDALIHLVFQIMLMNAWNRLSIALELEA